MARVEHRRRDDDRAAPCALCGRVPRAGLTAHHLIPRSCHANKWFKKRFERAHMQRTVAICRPCHSAVHRFVPDEKLLGREYASLSALRGHPEIAKFVRWVRRQR